MGFGGTGEGLRYALRVPPAEGDRAGRGVGDQLQVDATKCRDVLLDGEQLQRPRPGRRAQPGPAVRVAEQCGAGLGEGPGVARRDDQAGAADDFTDRAGIGRDRGAAAEHRLHQGARKALDDAGEHHHRTGGIGVLQGRHLGAADLLEADRALADGTGVGRLVGEELGGQRPAVREISGRLGVAADAADDPQGGLRLGLADLGEGVQQREEVLRGLDVADPHQRLGVVRRGVRDGGEGVGVHARVDRAQPGPVGAAALLPAAGVGVAGGHQRGLRIGLGDQRALKGREQRAHRRTQRRGGAREIVLAQPYAVLGDQERGAEEAFGQQPREGGRAT